MFTIRFTAIFLMTIGFIGVVLTPCTAQFLRSVRTSGLLADYPERTRANGQAQDEFGLVTCAGRIIGSRGANVSVESEYPRVGCWYAL